MPNCPLCNDTKLIPFKNKEGKVIVGAFLDCECRKPPRDHYTTVTPSDFDFPMSDTCRGYSYQLCNQQDPANTKSYRELPDITAIEAEQDLGKNWQASKIWRHQVERLKSQVLYLQGKLNEQTKPKEKSKKPTGYKGIK